MEKLKTPPLLQFGSPNLAEAWRQWEQQFRIYFASISHLFRSSGIIIPTALRPEMLRIIHEGHQGAERCKGRARMVMYWPNMTRSIDEVVRKCPACLRHGRSKTKEPLIPHGIPERPWQKLAADIMTLQGKDFLLVVDYYSKYVELPLLQDKTADSVITALKSTFARHGIPEELICDNMPFASHQMSRFAEDWGCKITTSSPEYPQSNGLAERNVQTIKQLLRKCRHDGSDPYLALLNFRSTPIPELNASPTQLLMGREVKTKLPMVTTLLEPRLVPEVSQGLQERQESQKRYYDRGAKTERDLKPGDLVRIQRGKQWEPAVVAANHSAPRSYMVNQDGRLLRRNRRHLRPTPESPPATTPEPVSDETTYEQQPADTGSTDEEPPGTRQADTTEYVTSSGRAVRRPKRLDDYV